MSVEALVVRYGLPALFVGAGLEGEAVVIAGGVMAHRGLVPLAGVMAVAAAGSFAADQLWFLAGRRFRDHRFVRRIRARPAFARALGWLEAHPIGFIFAFRFVYGFRTVSPIAVGTSGVAARTYVAVNAVSASLWAVLCTLVGWFFSHAVQVALGHLRPSRETIATGAVVAVALAGIAGAVQWWRRQGPRGAA